MLGKETVHARMGNPIAYYSTLARVLGQEPLQDAPTKYPPLANREVNRVR